MGTYDVYLDAYPNQTLSERQPEWYSGSMPTHTITPISLCHNCHSPIGPCQCHSPAANSFVIVCHRFHVISVIGVGGVRMTQADDYVYAFTQKKLFTIRLELCHSERMFTFHGCTAIGTYA